MVRKPTLIAILALLAALTGCTQPTNRAGSVAETITTTTVSTPPGTGGTAGKPFDDFVEDSFQELTLREPELVTGLGLNSAFRIRPDQLDDLSAGYAAETNGLLAATLSQLRTYEPDGLTPEQLTTYRAYEWHLEIQIEAHQFRLHEWPVHFLLNSYNEGASLLFTSIHPLTDREDVDDFITRLHAIPVQVDQVILWMEEAEHAGILPPNYVIGITVDRLEGDIGGGDVDQMPILQSFNDRLSGLALDSDDVAEYEQEVRSALEDSFIPSWQKLIEHLDGIEGADNQISLSRLPDGDAYYEHLLRRHTSTELSAEEIHQLGWDQADRTKREIADLATGAGFGELSAGQFRSLAAGEGGFASGDEVVSTYEQLISEASNHFTEYFNVVRTTPLQVVTDPGPVAYYVTPAADASRPGQFHAGTGGRPTPRYVMPSLAYHEAVPGHHFQLSVALESSLPSPQRFLVSTGHAEGWALYAERLADEVGLYAGNPLGNFGRLDYELLRAARLIVDTGIHYFGWTREDAARTMSEVMDGERFNEEIERYVLYPGQATAYMVGMLAILDLRSQSIGSDASPDAMAEFHDAVIGHGNLPLEVLSPIGG
jgi:uncharacterized protein (DUF885 family)